MGKQTDDTSDREYDGGYRRVWGLQFKQPERDNYGLNDESIVDAPVYGLTLLFALIPFVGVAMAIPTAVIGFMGRHDNPFCIDEQFWKIGVISLIYQSLVVLAAWVFILP